MVSKAPIDRENISASSFTDPRRQAIQIFSVMTDEFDGSYIVINNHYFRTFHLTRQRPFS